MSRDADFPAPRSAAWEITWRRPVADAPPRRPELSVAEAAQVAAQLTSLGVPLVTLTGGEPLLRSDWGAIAEALLRGGAEVELETSGRLLTERVADHLAALGISGVRVVAQGLRPPPGQRAALARTLRGAGRVRDRGIRTTAITRVHGGNIDQLTATHARLRAEGFDHWEVQLAHPGVQTRGAVGMLPRRRLPELVTLLARLAGDPDLPPVVHHTIGYLSREEPILRTSGRASPATFWRGTPCGRLELGIAPDGSVKGCAHQVGAPFLVGSLRQEPLSAIWQDRRRWFWVRPPPARAEGACAPCGLKAICGGGCPCVAHAVTGRIFDTPMGGRAARREVAG